MQDNLFNKTRNLRISSHAIWTMQRTSSVPTMDQRGPYGTHRHVLHHLSGRHTPIFKYPTTTPKRRQQYPRNNTKIGDEGQTIQMLIPPKPDGISRIYYWTRRGQDSPSQDTSHPGLDGPQENTRDPMLPRIL